jgi:hypothetical protein
MQKLAWNGIPHNYRSSAWKIMLASAVHLYSRFAVHFNPHAGLHARAGAAARGGSS